MCGNMEKRHLEDALAQTQRELEDTRAALHYALDAVHTLQQSLQKLQKNK